MLKRFKKYFISNYEKIKLSMSLTLGISALIFLIFYLIGCFLNLWEYNIIELVFNPIAGAIIVTVPIFAMIIIMRFFNYNKTRMLFCQIVKAHRDRISFFLQKDDRGNPDNEIRYVLWGNYEGASFRFSYTLGHPLMISLICNKADTNLIKMHRMLQKLKLKNVHLNCYGLTLEISKPFYTDNIIGIPAKLDLLIKDFSLLLNKSPEDQAETKIPVKN
jgi:FlaA1/EpsC-like NDP-sugar epimerase